jgi:23S rRNA (adenine2503-C2)-methyltransferase
MGMGEPLLNYDNMRKSIEFMTGQQYFGLSKRHITISTSGIIDGIDKLIRDKIDVMLALSLHAPNQQLREKLIPTISKRFTLELLMQAIDRYTEATGNRIFYEYIMIKDMTDTPQLAHELGHLLQHRPGHVNLIPYNPNPAMPDLEESPRQIILDFQSILQSYDVTTTVRDTLGRKVKGACGQL